MAALVIIVCSILFFYWMLKIGGLLDNKNSKQEEKTYKGKPIYSSNTIRDIPKHHNVTPDNPKGCNEYLDNPFGSDGKEYGLVGMQYLHLENKDYGVNYGVAFAETDNKYDKYAISIRYSANEKTVAYLPRENKELHEYILSVGGQTSAAFKIWTRDGIKIHGLAYVEVKPHTTKKELEGYEIIREICSEIVEKHEIGYKDTHSYLNITFGASTRYTICRLYLNTANYYLEYADFSSGTRKYIKVRINKLKDLLTYRTEIINALKFIIDQKK
jgi:hypothetical protein